MCWRSTLLLAVILTIVPFTAFGGQQAIFEMTVAPGAQIDFLLIDAAGGEQLENFTDDDGDGIVSFVTDIPPEPVCGYVHDVGSSELCVLLRPVALTSGAQLPMFLNPGGVNLMSTIDLADIVGAPSFSIGQQVSIDAGSIPDWPNQTVLDGGTLDFIERARNGDTLPPFTGIATVAHLITIQVVPTPLPGDGNGDGWVDGLDYLLWAGNFGTHPGPDGDVSDGDYNDDGWIDGLDYLLWAGNFGSHSAASVPEPASALMLVLGLCAVVTTARCRR